MPRTTQKTATGPARLVPVAAARMVIAFLREQHRQYVAGIGKDRKDMHDFTDYVLPDDEGGYLADYIDRDDAIIIVDSVVARRLASGVLYEIGNVDPKLDALRAACRKFGPKAFHRGMESYYSPSGGVFAHYDRVADREMEEWRKRRNRPKASA